MLKRFVSKLRWRNYRLQVWNKRLQHELANTSARLSTGIDVVLRVSWGPFFNGAAILNRQASKAMILLQIPYDFYLTANENQVIKEFRIPARHLPYFILNHEYFHLIDTLSSLNSGMSIQDIVESNRHLAVNTLSYRELPFEHEADEFAYSCYRDQKRKAG